MVDVIECSICIEFYSEHQNDYFVVTQCGHFFHKFCIDSVFQAGRFTCPDCRKSIEERKLTKVHRLQPVKCVKKFKVTVIGDPGVGKTCLSRRYAEGRFNEISLPTVGHDFWVKEVQVGEEKIILNIWDTSGQENYKSSITPQYVRNSQGVIIVYDTKHADTLENVVEWVKFANLYAPLAVKILIGAKQDIKRCNCSRSNCILPMEAQKEEITQALGLYRFETSAKTDHNIEIAFRTMIGEILQNRYLLREARFSNHSRINLNVEDGPSPEPVVDRSCNC